MNQRGYTLIELLAVLIILSILMAIAVPKFIDFDNRAERSLLVAVLDEFNAQEQLAYLDNRLSDDPKDPYVMPIKIDSKLSNGMTLKGGDPNYVLFTGGGEFPVYRWSYDSAASTWHDYPQPDDQIDSGTDDTSDDTDPADPNPVCKEKKCKGKKQSWDPVSCKCVKS